MKIRILIFLLFICLALFALPELRLIEAQGVSDTVIKTAISNSLKSRPPWEMISGGALGLPSKVRAQSVTIVRRGQYNNQKGYWPIQAHVSGTVDKKYHDGTSKRCVFEGTTDFQIYKNDYGDWTARVASSYAAETQLKPDCTGQTAPSQPQGGAPGDKQWQAFLDELCKGCSIP